MSEQEERELAASLGLPALTVRELLRLRERLGHRPLMIDCEGRVIDEYKGTNIQAEGGLHGE